MTVLQHDEDKIDAKVAYLKHDPLYKTEKLFIMTYVPQGQSIKDGPLPRSNCVNQLLPVQIHNARSIVPSPTINDFGFTVAKVKPTISMAEFDDPDKVEDCFYPQVEEMLAKLFTDAAYVRMLEHQIRKRHQEFPIATGVAYEDLLPTTLVHIDFTPFSTRKTSVAAFKATPKHYSRLIAVNLWKSLQGPGNDWPLALCDTRTVDYKNEVVVQDIVYENRFTENARVYPSSRHQWYYYKDLQEDEIIVFQQCDTEAEGGNGVPHTGFYNPAAANNAKPRVSIELRAYIYFD